ncbi:MAG: exo-alpha-sialidase [Bacteroidales bacterium]
MLKSLRSLPWVLALLMFAPVVNAQVGPEGKYLTLNGINQFVVIQNHADFNIAPGESLTISCRIRPDDFDSLYYIFSKGGYLDPNSRFGLFTHSSSTLPNLGFRLFNENGTDLGVSRLTHLGACEWVHVAWVYNGSKKSTLFYLNGNLLSTVINQAIGRQSVSNSSNLYIGCTITDSEHPFKSNHWPGQLDELRIWKRALPAPDIQADMGNSTPATDGLVAAYNFEHENGKSIPDISGKNHTATMVGYEIRVFKTTLPVGRGEKSERLIGFRLNGGAGNERLTSVMVDLIGTTAFTDITSLKVYYNGNRERLDLEKAKLFGSAKPGKSVSKVKVSGDLTLLPGENYFWVTADIHPSAREGNRLEAKMLTITKGNGTILNLPEEKATRVILLTSKLLFKGGDGGSRHYRIPAIVTARDGSLVTTTDKRWNNSFDLPAHIDVVVRRSTDNGDTWSPPVTIAGEGSDDGFGDAALVVNRRNGEIICLFASERSFYGSTAQRPINIYQCISKDNGITWSQPIDITNQIYGAGCANPVSREWQGAFVTSGSALQLKNGRIMAAMPVREDATRKISNFVIYSDDNAKTWNVSTWRASDIGGEAKLLDLDNGNILMSIRNDGQRLFVLSADRGMSWGTPFPMNDLPDPSCNGDLIRYTSISSGFWKSRILHSIPYSASRVNVSVLMSYDEGATWPVRKTIYAGASAYSSLTVLHDGTIGIYYEVGEYEHYEMYFVRFSLQWLTNGRDQLSDRWHTDITSSNPAELPEQQFVVYPNPADDFIHLTGPIGPGSIIELFGPTGILHQRIEVENELYTIRLNISDMSPGIGMAKINGAVIKFVVR